MNEFLNRITSSPDCSGSKSGYAISVRYISLSSVTIKLYPVDKGLSNGLNANDPPFEQLGPGGLNLKTILEHNNYINIITIIIIK